MAEECVYTHAVLSARQTFVRCCQVWAPGLENRVPFQEFQSEAIVRFVCFRVVEIHHAGRSSSRSPFKTTTPSSCTTAASFRQTWQTPGIVHGTGSAPLGAPQHSQRKVVISYEARPPPLGSVDGTTLGKIAPIAKTREG